MTTSILLFFFKGSGDGHLHFSYSSLGHGRWSPSFRVKEEIAGETNLRRERERDGHLHSHYSYLRDCRDGHLHSSYSCSRGEEMTASICLFLFRGWGDGHPSSSLNRKKLIQSEKEKRDGQLHSHYSSLRDWRDCRIHSSYTSSKDW